MSNTFSRRDFMKATAAAVLAVSVSGALTGCGGNAVELTRITLGEFDVAVEMGEIRNVQEKQSGQEIVTSYTHAPKVYIKYNGKSTLTIDNFSEVFSAKIGDTELKLKNGSSSVNSSKLLMGYSMTYVPEFSASEDVEDTFKKGTPFKMYVTLQSKTAEFTMTKDWKVTVKTVEKKS